VYRDQGRMVSSATDLVNYLVCRHLTALDLQQLADPQPLPEQDPAARAAPTQGRWVGSGVPASAEDRSVDVVEILRTGTREAQIAATLDAMNAGAAVIFQAALGRPGWFGRADFLRRVDRPSQLGPWSYEASGEPIKGPVPGTPQSQYARLPQGEGDSRRVAARGRSPGPWRRRLSRPTGLS
jgi:hypothetical protein